MERIMVWGMAKSGIAAAKLLAEKGYFVRINDLKTADKLEGIEALAGLSIDNKLGMPADGLLSDIDTLVMSPGIPADHKVANNAREMGIKVIGEIELAYLFAKGRMIGITGTNGKTTTTTLLGEICKAWGKNTIVVGNIGEPYAAHVSELDEESYTVCELSSFQLETTRTMRPDVALILNLTEDHLNRHKTMEKYASIKERIFMNMDTGSVILNADDPITVKMAENVKCRVVWFSRKKEVSLGAFVRDGKVIYRDGSDNEIIDTKLVGIPGPHNLENALAAVAGAMCAGAPVEVIRETLISFKGVEHRIETVRTVNGITYINDSKGTNPDSTIKAVETMTKPTVILLGGSEKYSDYSAMCEVIKNSSVKYAVLMGDTGEAIGRVLSAAGFTAMEYVDHDFEKAIRTATAHASDGWNVLLSPACASFDMFSCFEERGEIFKNIVNNL